MYSEKNKDNSEEVKNENIEDIDSVGYGNQDISNNHEIMTNSPINPNCLDNENVPFDEISNSLDENENEDFKNKCFKEINSEIFLKTLINILFAKKCLQDFMLLIRQITDGSLPVTNIAFLLCLERAKWQSLGSTAAMRFRKITKKF